jgi:hypothetical protein
MARNDGGYSVVTAHAPEFLASQATPVDVRASRCCAGGLKRAALSSRIVPPTREDNAK